MISAQYGTVFTNSHYEKIQKVYSVWICMNPPKERNNTITEYSLTEKHHIGKVKEKEELYDLISAIMICLGKNEEEAESELLHLLDVLLSNNKKAKEKKEILENRFKIPMTEKFKTEVEYMCNLSDGVEQKGIQKGIEIGIEQGIEQGKLSTLCGLVYDNILSLEEAAKRMNITVEEFQEVMKNV